MVDPLQILCDNHQCCGKATPNQVKDPSGDATPDEKDDVKLTSEDIGDNMEDI